MNTYLIIILFLSIITLVALTELYQAQIYRYLCRVYGKLCSLIQPFLFWRKQRKAIDWDRWFLFSFAISLVLVLFLTWAGRFRRPADPASDIDHWFFEGLRVVFAVLEGDSADFRSHASYCPILPAVLAISVPLSAIGSALTLLWHYLPHHVPCFNRVWYIFSDLEPNSVRLAKSIQQDMGDDTGIFIFLRTQRGRPAPDLLAQLEGVNYFLYPKNETAFLRWPWRRRRILRFFFLSDNTDENFSRMQEFLINVGQRYLFNPTSIKMEDGSFQHELYLLSETESASMLIDHLRHGLLEAAYPHTFHNTELRLLDRFRALSYDLLWEKPLHKFCTPSPLTGSLHTNILVLGFGKIGREFFRAASSVGMTYNCRLNFTLCDLDIQRKLNAFIQQCPELDQSVNFQEQTLDAESNQLEELILRRDFHYILVALGDDERNIRIATRLKQHYRKRYWKDANTNQPQISVNIEDALKHEYVRNLWNNEDQTNHSLLVFGGLDQAFSKTVLMPRNLWLAARWIHYQLNPHTSGMRKEWTEYERRSSIACAIHAVYYADTFSNLDKLPDRLLDALINAEHCRWMAYVRSEGMQRADLALVNAYYEKLGNRHVDILGLLTPCLVDSETLKTVQQYIDALRARSSPPRSISKNVKSFRERDEFIVRNAATIKQIILTGVIPNTPHVSGTVSSSKQDVFHIHHANTDGNSDRFTQPVDMGQKPHT